MYTLIMMAAVGAGAFACRRTQTGLDLRAEEKLAIGLGAFCGAMIGAKLPFVLSDWRGMLTGVAWFSNGKTIMCGLVGGYVGVELAKWALEIRVKTGDSFAAPVALAVGVGRLACYVGGCCFGAPTNLPWGVVFPAVDAVRRHPTQIYEAIFHLTAAAGLIWAGRRGLFTGQRVKLYIMAYLLYRFLTEFIRPEPELWGGLTGYQWAALLLLPLFAGLWWRDRP